MPNFANADATYPTANGGNKRVFNLSAGPSCLPTNVLQRAQAEFLNFEGKGMSFIEMSHRDAGGPVQQALEELCSLTRTLLKVPDNYRVLLFQSGAHGQFAAVPLNMRAKKAGYVLTGAWSEKAANEAKQFCDVRVVHDAQDRDYRSIGSAREWDVQPDDAYTYICMNETIQGLEVLDEDELLAGYPADGPPVVADMTSTLLSRPLDVSKFGVVFASSGKNLGPAGLCVVLVREDLLPTEPTGCPSVLDWAKMANSAPIPNIYNTPPTYICHLVRLTLRDLIARGGCGWASARAERRAQLLYDQIDASAGFFLNDVDPEFRSRMNVPFRVAGSGGQPCRELESIFVEEAAASGILQVFGHPLFGGLRATLYNGVPDEAVLALRDFMRVFQARHSMVQTSTRTHFEARYC